MAQMDGGRGRGELPRRVLIVLPDAAKGPHQSWNQHQHNPRSLAEFGDDKNANHGEGDHCTHRADRNLCFPARVPLLEAVQHHSSLTKGERCVHPDGEQRNQRGGHGVEDYHQEARE